MFIPKKPVTSVAGIISTVRIDSRLDPAFPAAVAITPSPQRHQDEVNAAI